YLLEIGANVWRPRTAALNEHVGSNRAARLAHQSGPHTLDDRSERHDGGDANRDANEEEQQPPPGRSKLASDHLENEGHDRAAGSAISVAGIRDPGSGIRGAGSAIRFVVFDTTRPSRSAIAMCATRARSGSWVTSTSVVPRDRWTPSNRSMICR